MLCRAFVTLLASCALLTFGCGGSATVATAPVVLAEEADDSKVFPSEEELFALIKERVDQKQATGIVLAVREADGTHKIVSYGDPGPGALPLGPKSVFEIGSITKTFTGILLADMVAKGEVGLDDPVSKHAHEGVTIPSHGDRPIRLVDLSSHTSGLPVTPDNVISKDERTPSANYTVDLLHAFLSGHKLQREAGAEVGYSNVGTGLLGHILATVNGTDWETLAKTRILEPLAMTMTGVTLTPSMEKHLARGHDFMGQVTPHWDTSTLAGAGALQSNAEDMLRYLDANLGGSSTSLHAAMQVSHKPRVDAGPKMKIGLNWMIFATGNHELVKHSGATGGYRSFIAFDKERGVGVVILENSRLAPDDLGLHLLDNSLPLIEYPREVEVNAENLAQYVGVYEFGPSDQLAVTLGDGGLIVKPVGQPPLPLYAESETEFFHRTVNAQITFVRDEVAEVTGLVLHQGGDHPAKKVK